MWGARYWGIRYFGARYWGKVGATGMTAEPAWIFTATTRRFVFQATQRGRA